jgi:hypothetical protein
MRERQYWRLIVLLRVTGIEVGIRCCHDVTSPTVCYHVWGHYSMTYVVYISMSDHIE